MENHSLRTGFRDPHGGQHGDFPDSQLPIVKTYGGADYYGRLWVWDTELLIPKTLGRQTMFMWMFAQRCPIGWIENPERPS